MNAPEKLPHIYPVSSHTDHIGPNSTFVTVRGMKEDGVAYIPLALSKGAQTIVVERDVQLPAEIEHEITKHHAKVHRVGNARLALAQLSAQAWGYPAKKLKIIAVTGTKGKTTTSFILAHLLAAAGKKTALLTTVYNKIGNRIYPTHLTTQHPDYLHMFLVQCVKAGIEYVVMETAAQAFSLSRVAGITFDAGIFTNFAQEHGEFYPTLDEYFAAKCQLFAQVSDLSRMVVNADDSWGQKMLAQHRCTSFGLSQVQVAQNNRDGLVFSYDGNTYAAPALLGTHNIYNALGAIQLARLCNVSLQDIQAGMVTFTGVPGRLERYALPNGSVGVIDYAHNPSSFHAILPLLRTLCSKLIVVFGCGGDREAGKRPVMGHIAAEIADVVILTTDNPRSEDPVNITRQIAAGIPADLRQKVHIELDREKAIKLAYEHAQGQTIIALLGKGPEEYQVVGTTKVPFSERTVLKSL